jgi:uncharacterized protein (TIGR00297 family)
VLDLPRIAAGLLLSALIGGLACWRGSLTAGGWLGAVLTGTATFGFGGWAWGLALIVFFVTSSALSRFRQRQKERIAGEKFAKGSRRDLWQALANGGAGGVLATLYGLSGDPPALLALFAGVMATVTADTWATELGVLSRRSPRLVTTGRQVPPGTSGGVTLTGTLAAAAGALTIGLALAAFERLERGVWLPWLAPAALLGGVAGALADSLLGATLQALYRGPAGETERSRGPEGQPYPLLRGWPWMTNDVVNFLSSLVGGAAALLAARLLAG